jgi:dinuclear metal center YbgI/SA1388 family protein
MPNVQDVASVIEEFAPISLQESYDNCGLNVGSPLMEVKAVLITLDVTEEVINEAIDLGANLIISHHPLIFGGLKSITGKSPVERTVIKAIQSDIAIYISHTNLDKTFGGVSFKMAEMLELSNTRVLSPEKNSLLKLVTFVPSSHLEKVRTAIFDAGAGQIGEYDSCGFSLLGTGTFKGSEITNPFLGKPGELHEEQEIRFETILPTRLQHKVLKALFENHPYEEVAFDLYPLNNTHPRQGLGVVGELPVPVDEKMFIEQVKKKFKAECVKSSTLQGNQVYRVAICGGSGFSLAGEAIKAGADAFITADVKYHQFFEVDKKTLLLDIGHNESEQFTKELIFDILKKKISNFAIYFSKTNTNPINYF